MRVQWFSACALGALSALSCAPSREAPVEVVFEAPPLIPRRDLLLRDRVSVRLSPEGDRLAFIVPEDEPELALASREAPTEERRLAVEGEGILELVGWADEERLLYGRLDPAGERQLFALDVDSGRSLPLTPSGRHAEVLAIGTRRPGELVVALNARDPRWLDLYRVELASGKRTLIEPNERFVGFGLDRDGDVRLAFEATRDGDLRVLQRAEEGAWVDLFRPKIAARGRTAFLGFGRSAEIAYFVSAASGEASSVEALRLTSGESRVLFSEAADVTQVLIDPANHEVQAVATAGARQRWRIIDENIRGDLDYLQDLVEGAVEILDRSRDDRRWLVALTPDRGVRRLVLHDRSIGEADFLFVDRSGLENVELAPSHPQVVALDGERSLRVRLSLPPELDSNRDGRPARPLPTVLWVQDRASAQGDPDPSAVPRWLTNRGYAVVTVDLPTGTAPRERAGPAYESLVAAADWAVEEGIAREERIAVMGAGYGGFAALAALGQSPGTFTCGVTLSGPCPQSGARRSGGTGPEGHARVLGPLGQDRGRTRGRRHSRRLPQRGLDPRPVLLAARFRRARRVLPGRLSGRPGGADHRRAGRRGRDRRRPGASDGAAGASGAPLG